jgi:hypothetical protein
MHPNPAESDGSLDPDLEVVADTARCQKQRVDALDVDAVEGSTLFAISTSCTRRRRDQRRACARRTSLDDPRGTVKRYTDRGHLICFCQVMVGREPRNRSGCHARPCRASRRTGSVMTPSIARQSGRVSATDRGCPREHAKVDPEQVLCIRRTVYRTSLKRRGFQAAMDDESDPKQSETRRCRRCGEETLPGRMVLNTQTETTVKVFECPNGHLHWEDG